MFIYCVVSEAWMISHQYPSYSACYSIIIKVLYVFGVSISYLVCCGGGLWKEMVFDVFNTMKVIPIFVMAQRGTMIWPPECQGQVIKCSRMENSILDDIGYRTRSGKNILQTLQCRECSNLWTCRVLPEEQKKNQHRWKVSIPETFNHSTHSSDEDNGSSLQNDPRPDIIKFEHKDHWCLPT